MIMISISCHIVQTILALFRYAVTICDFYLYLIHM